MKSKDKQALYDALPVGAVFSIFMRNGYQVRDYVNSKGWTVGLHGASSIHYYSAHTMRHIGEICFDHFDSVGISKTHVRLDDCTLLIRRKS